MPMLTLKSYEYPMSSVSARYDGAGSKLGQAVPCLRYLPSGATKARVFVGKCAIVFECPDLIKYCYGLTGKVALACVF